MKLLREALQKGLCNAFPETGGLPNPGQRLAEASVSQRRSSGEGGRLTDAFRQFFSLESDRFQKPLPASNLHGAGIPRGKIRLGDLSNQKSTGLLGLEDGPLARSCSICN